MWALAAMFHIAGNAPYGQISPVPTPRGIATLLLGLVAVTLLVRFSAWLVVALATLVVATAVLEAPVLGNHWMLAAMISSVLLLATWKGRGDPPAVTCTFLPVAAGVTVVAYAFMAFSKLNTGFLDPSVSCAAVFASRLVTSWGLPAIEAAPMRAAAIGITVITELAIPFLLAVPRARMVGVALGTAFHGIVGLDLRQHFWDFSSVLLALFFLFASDDLVRLAWAEVSPRRARIAAGAWLAALLALAGPPSAIGRVLVVGLGHLMWVLTLGTVVVLWLRYMKTGRAWAPVSLPGRPGWPWLALPLLAAVNGLSPYLEIKTAFSFNMYANLRTDRGTTNHLLVPRTWPLTRMHDGLVIVHSTDDAGLATYVASGYAVPWVEFRAYLQSRPDTAVTYERDGALYSVARAADDPRLMEPVSPVRRRLLPARAVDLTDPPRCQAAWGPAR